MSTPSFDPQPCSCGGDATVIPDPLNVNVVSPDPVNVLVTNQLAEPFDVNVISPLPLDVNVTNQLAEPFDVNVISTVPVSVSIGGSTAAASTLTTATTGNGTTVDFTSARTDVTLFIMVNGTVTGGVVDLQASQDGVNWARVSSSAALATGVNQHLGISGGAFRWFRGVVSSNVTGGGTVTATLMYA